MEVICATAIQDPRALLVYTPAWRYVDSGVRQLDLPCHNERGGPLWHWPLVLHYPKGKGQIKITIVTAYNATPGTGDNTYHQQQNRVISRMQ